MSLISNKSTFYNSYQSYIESLTIDLLNSYNQGNLNKDLSAIFQNLKETKNINEGFFGSENYLGVNLMISSEHSYAGLKFETRFFVLAFSDEDDTFFHRTVDAIASGVWAFEANSGFIFILGKNKEKQQNWIKEINKSLEDVSIYNTISFLLGKDIGKFVAKNLTNK